MTYNTQHTHFSLAYMGFIAPSPPRVADRIINIKTLCASYSRIPIKNIIVLIKGII